MPLLWSEHINAILHQFLTENIFIHIKENEPENNTVPKYSVRNLPNVKVLGLLLSESGLFNSHCVCVCQERALARIFSLGKLKMLMIFLLDIILELVWSHEFIVRLGDAREQAHGSSPWIMAIPFKKPLPRFSHFWVNCMYIFPEDFPGLSFYLES